MKAFWGFSRLRRLLPIAGLWLLPFSPLAAQGPAPPANYSTNAHDKTECERRLNIIYGAIQEYRIQHENRFPDKLSDLAPNFLHDPNALVCPVVRNRGGLRTWRKRFRELSADADTSYSYELASSLLDHNLWRGVPRKSWKEFKLRVAQELGEVVPIVRCHDHRPWLNLAMSGKIYESGEYWETNFTRNETFLTVATLFTNDVPPRPKTAADFPRRDPRAEARALDLTGYYNATLSRPWQGFPGNDLASFPAGLQEFDGIPFDARGVIQLRGRELPAKFPKQVDGIPARQKCRRIHFLHAVSFLFGTGWTNGFYVIHYADGQVREILLRHGRDIADWWQDREKPSPPTNAKAVWTGENEAARAYGKGISLYHFTWENPRKEVEVATISFDAGPRAHGPFLLAITLE